MEYIMQKMPDMQGTGEKKFYPKVKHALCIPHNTIMKMFMDITRVPRASFEGVIKDLPEVLNAYLSEGHSVKIDGFGTFDLILGQLTEDEMDSPKRYKLYANQDGVYIKKINFLPDQEWVRGLRRSTELNRVEGYREKLEASSSLEERRQMMLAFIEAKGCMTVRDYMTRTGYGSRVAARELNAFCDDPECGIRCVTVVKSKVYVKK